MHVKTRAMVAGVLAALLLLAGCGDDSSSGSSAGDDVETDRTVPVPAGPLAALRSAVAKASESGSARFSISIDIGAAPGAEQLESMGGFSGKGAFDGTNSQMVMSIAGMEMEMIATPEWTYQRFPGSDGWVKVRGAGASAQSGSLDPRAILESLGAGGAEVLDAGQEEIDGVTYDRLDAKVDLGSFMAEGLEELGDEALTEEFQSMAGMLDDLALTIWVDPAADVVRRVTVDMGPALGGMSQTIDYMDWGDESIRVEPPADAREITLEELAQIATSLGGN